MRLGTFELLHRLVEYDPRFGHSTYGIFATPRDTALKLLMESDIVVLTGPVLGRVLPIDCKIGEYWVELDTWTRRNRVLRTSAEIYGVPHRVYVRAIDGHLQAK